MRWLLAKFIFKLAKLLIKLLIKISQVYLCKDKANEYKYLILIWIQIYVFFIHILKLCNTLKTDENLVGSRL